MVIQSDRLAVAASVSVCLITSELTGDSPVRLPVDPDPANGLRKRSEVMVEKIMTFRRDRFGPVVGRLGLEALAELDRRLAFVLDLDR